MNKKKYILIIGADSYIARNFIVKTQEIFDFYLISRTETRLGKETVLDDFFQIENKIFKGIDIVINFAAIVHQPKNKNVKLYKKINTDLPYFLAKIAKKRGIKQFIQMSTIAVYGDNNSISKTSIEESQTIYGKSKLEADKKLLQLNDIIFKVSIVRPPMVYGGGKAPGNMMKLIKLSKTGFPMPLKNINNERDYININNLIIALNTVVEHKISGVIIPTDKKSISTSKILELIKKKSKSKVRIINAPTILLFFLKMIIPKQFYKIYGSLKVECNLNNDVYQPKYSFEQGIEEMV